MSFTQRPNMTAPQTHKLTLPRRKTQSVRSIVPSWVLQDALVGDLAYIGRMEPTLAYPVGQQVDGEQYIVIQKKELELASGSCSHSKQASVPIL